MQPLRTIIALAGLLVLSGCAGRHPPSRHEGFVSLASGGRLYYRVSGAGRDTIVVLHGGPGLHGRYLDEALAPLAADHVLIVYDQRGRGRSDFPSDTLGVSADSDVADLEAVRAFFRLDRMTLIGHGWGAGLGALYALRHPDRVRRLALISPMFPRAGYVSYLLFQHAAGADTSGLEGLMAARLAGDDRRDPASFCRRYWGAMLSPTLVRDRTVIERLSASVCEAPPSALGRIELINRRVMGSLGAWDWAAQLASVRVPVLVIQGAAPRAGEHDEGGTWLAAARDWTSSVPDARLVLVGTIPQFPWLDAHPQFLDAMRVFLSQGWPANAQQIGAPDASRQSRAGRD